MRVVFGLAQYEAVRHWAPARCLPYLDAAERTPQRRSVAMPVAGWVALGDVLEREAFNHWGQYRYSKMVASKRGTKAAVHAIHRVLTTLQAHPALSGFVVMGYSNEHFQVWLDGIRWSLVPVGGEEMQVLVPVTEPRVLESSRVGFRSPVTRWRAEPWDDRWTRLGLFPPEEHTGWSDVDESLPGEEPVVAVEEDRRV